ncbi:MAG: Na+/H+ antiporter subunit [Devosia sp.]|nr:Na+/H+ antiporter subunit [Devosia sp.]
MFNDALVFASIVLVIFGALFGLLAAIGLLRFPDFYTRMHAASKAGAVGCGLIFAAIAMVSLDGPVALRAGLGIGFVLLTTPLSAHLLARASYLTGHRPAASTAVDEFADTER